jgi:hypothetical protein
MQISYVMQNYKARTAGHSAVMLILLLFVPLRCCGQSDNSSKPENQNRTPAWSRSSEQVGYNAAPRNFSFRVGGHFVKVQFMDNKRLALAWVTPDKPIKRQAGRIRVPSHLHLSVLDAQTGQQLVTHEWPCTSQPSNLSYTATGEWLLGSGDSIVLYSSSFEKVRDLRDVEPNINLTPSARLFFTSVTGPQGSRLSELRNSGTFELVDSWNDAGDPKTYITTYSDRFVLAAVAGWHGFEEFLIREIGKDWRPFLRTSQESPPFMAPRYAFLNEDTLLLLAGDQLLAETVTGQELLRQKFHNHELPFDLMSNLAISRSGDRFALVLQRTKGFENEMMDFKRLADGRVTVYSLAEKASIVSVPVSGQGFFLDFSAWNTIALSPEGLLLAIASDKNVRVYALPPDAQANH